MKTCTKCGGEKPESEFYKRCGRDTLHNWCKKCFCACNRKNLSSMKEENPGRVRKMNSIRARKLNYGLSKEAYANLLTEQEGRCALCGEEFSSLNNKRKIHVDHCHVTGRLRGLLCFSCNVGLGNFKDSKMRLLLAIRYLQKFSS